MDAWGVDLRNVFSLFFSVARDRAFIPYKGSFGIRSDLISATRNATSGLTRLANRIRAARRCADSLVNFRFRWAPRHCLSTLTVGALIGAFAILRLIQ